MYDEEMVHLTPQEEKPQVDLVVSYDDPPLQLGLFESDAIGRPDYNFGKYMGVIFISPQSRRVYDTREHILNVDEKEGKTTSIIVRPSKGDKTPTTTSARVYLALLELWEHQGKREDGRVYFSARLLTEIMGKKWQGKSSAELVSEHIGILRRTTIDWYNTHTLPNGIPETVKTDINILTESAYAERRYVGKAERWMKVQMVQIAPSIIASKLADHVRPINQQTLKEITDDTAAILFSILDLHLGGIKTAKDFPERRRNATTVIRSDLGFTTDRYKKKAHRFTLLSRLVKTLDGRELVNGKLKVWLKENASGTDYNLHYRKEVRIQPARRTPVKPVNSREEARLIAEDIADQILRHPKSGKPNIGVFTHFAMYMPQNLLFQALSNVKADYPAHTLKKTLSGAFIDQCKRLAEQHGYKFPEKIPHTSQTSTPSGDQTETSEQQSALF